MKQSVSELLRKAQFPLLLALGFLPFPMMLFLFFAPDAFPYVWIIPAAYVLLSVAAFFVPGKLRLVFGLLGCGLLAALAVWMCQNITDYVVLLTAGLYGILLFMSLGIATWTREDELPFWISLLCLGLHLLFQALVWIFPQHQPLQQNQTWMILCFVGFVVLQMLSLNRISLFYASAGKPMASGMKRKNTVLTLLTVAAAALMASFAYLWKYLWKIFTSIMMWIKSIGSKGMGPSSETAVIPIVPGVGEMIPEKEPNPMIFAVFRVIFAVACAIALFYLLRYLLKKLLRFLARLRRYASRVTEDYTEEITNTLDEGDRENTANWRRRTRSRRRDIQKLSPAQQIRYYYLRLLYRHPKWSDASTARENLPKDMAALYEKARYSNDLPTEEEAEMFKSGIHKI